MAIGLLAVLQNLPWADVIGNAPLIADGAKKLWKAVAKKSPPPELPAASPQSALSPEAQAIAALEARLAAMEAAASDLHNQMLESSALITSLANLNTQLIKRVESNRIRLVWLSVATLGAGVVAATSLALVLLR